MVDILIYGAKQQARQLRFYVENECVARVAAFVVDLEFQTVTELEGIPVITFEEAVRNYPPENYEFAVSFAYQHMVHDRKEKCLKCRAAGYRLYTFVSKHATVFADTIGEGNIIYPGCNISCGVKMGEGNFLETGVTIAHHTQIGNWNFFAPTATVCGDALIGENNFLGAHSTVIDSGRIGKEVLVAAGAVVRQTEDGAVYLPERTKKWHGNSMEMKI